MRKITKFFALALLAGAMVSCSSDDAPSVSNEKVQVLLGGYINSVGTRATEDNWTPNDNIGVFMVNAGKTLNNAGILENVNNVQYTTAAGDGNFDPATGAKTIYFPVQGTVDFYAYYPYTTSSIENFKVALDVSDQTNQEAIDFMYAKTTDQNKAQPKVNMAFAHKLCYLVLDVKPGDGLKDADLESLTVIVKDQNTKAKFNLATGTISDATESKDIDMKDLGSKKFVAILLPTTDTSRVIEFHLNNLKGEVFTWTMSSTLEAGNKYHYTTVKLNKTKVEVSGTINSWTSTVDNNTYTAN